MIEPAAIPKMNLPTAMEYSLVISVRTPERMTRRHTICMHLSFPIWIFEVIRNAYDDTAKERSESGAQVGQSGEEGEVGRRFWRVTKGALPLSDHLKI